MVSDPQRMFFALWPDAAARDELVALQQSTPRHRGRATHPFDLHVTLVFLGMVDTVQQKCVETVASRTGASAFDLRIDVTDFWPRPRIAWCGPRHIPGSLESLVDQLKSGLLNCGFSPETRPYRPHVTLARDARSSASGPVSKPFVWHCDRFVLVTSTSARQPPRYRVAREWPLGDPAVIESSADS